jgi:hypothetical protein
LFTCANRQSGECINNAWGGGIPNADIAGGRAMVDSLLETTGALSISDLTDSSKFPPADPAVHFGISEYIDTSELASHFAELPFVFGTLSFLWDPPGDLLGVTDTNRALSAEVQTMWANFAKTGNPNLPEFNEWEAVTGDSSSTSSATDVPTFLFRSGSGQMESVSETVTQCSSFPYAVKAGLVDSPDPSSAPTSGTAPTSSAGNITKNRVIAALTITFHLMVLSMILG